MPNVARSRTIPTTGERVWALVSDPHNLPQKCSLLVVPMFHVTGCFATMGPTLATGHEGLGITTSLGTGRLIADQITGRTSEIPCQPYLPGRAC